MYGIKLIAILIVVGGLIAYIGDKMGMKVGKQRLSLFGLRPKYTSMIITICTGILIALISLTVLITASTSVRQALFDMRALLTKLDSLNQTLQTKNKSLSTLEHQIALKADKLKNLTQDKNKLQQKLNIIETEYGQLKTNKQNLETKVNKLTHQKRDLHKQVTNLAYNFRLFGRRYFQSLTQDLVYQQGAVVATDVISSTNSSAQITDSLQQLLAKVKQSVTYNQQEFQQVVSTLKQKERVIVRLLAAQNTFQQEKLKIKFDLYEDYKVYQQGAVILTAQLQFMDLADLEPKLEQLITKLNQQLIQAGLLPDSQGRVGELSLVQIHRVIDQLLAKNQESTELKVVASQELWRSDELSDKIEFLVE